MKKIEDYLPYYLGAIIRIDFMGLNNWTDREYGDYELIGIDEKQGYNLKATTTGVAMWYSKLESSCKLLLRPLEDMREIERTQFNALFEVNWAGEQSTESKAAQTAFLLSKHFDIFSLIQSGLALDKTKV